MSFAAHLSRPGPRSWVCPFANDNISHVLGEDEHEHQTNPSAIPRATKPFIASTIDEARYVTALQAGFQSYQLALETHRPFSHTFIAAEVSSITRTIVQLAHLGDIFNHLTIQASELEDGEEVPVEMREEFALGRGWVNKHRASLVSCHVFFKINFSLARDDPNDGVVDARFGGEMVQEVEEGIVELAKERQRRGSVAEVGLETNESRET